MTAPGTGGPAEDAQMRPCPTCGGARSFDDKGEWSCYGECGGYGTLPDSSAAAGSVPEDGGEAPRREGCMRADKACRWRPATTSDANPDDLVCDGCGARQRPMSEVERIEDLRDEYPQNGPLGKPEVRPDESLSTEVKRLHVLAAHRLDVMTEAKRVERDLLAAAAVRERREEAYEQGRWCGECRYGVVEDPPCCFLPTDRIAAAPVGRGSQDEDDESETRP